MENLSDNVFDMGLLYQTIQDLKAVRDKLTSRKNVTKDLDKIIGKLKAMLIEEVNKL